MRKVVIKNEPWLGKLPPQAIDLEQQLIGQCLSWEVNREYVTFLKPEHFYKDSHQTIWKAIISVPAPSIATVSQYLKKTGKLEEVGGSYALTQLSNQYMNVAQLEYSGRIIQQMFIKREIIRISAEMSQGAYDESVDCILLFDQYYNLMAELEKIFDQGTHGEVSTRENEQDYMERSRTGQIINGLSTGFDSLDQHYRFKPASFVICNGHDNVGKTAILVFMAVVSNRLHGWKWIIACMENSEPQIRKDTIQFVTGKPIGSLSESDYEKWYAWSLENFDIIRISDNITAPKLLKIAGRLTQKEKYHGFLIDPYNALDLDKGTDKFFNSHEYHYQVTSQMRLFIKKTGCSIYLNTHAVTEALRAKHKDGDYAGFPMPPEKADTEGGGKFSNRADDFITFHRYSQHPHDFNVTHIHVRKIKDTQTGGRPTPKDEPVKLKMIKGYFGFFDENGMSPLVSTSLPPRTNIPDYHDDQPF